MRWAYNLHGSSDGPLIRDFAVTDAGNIVDGEALAFAAEPNGTLLASSGPLGANFVGMSTETIDASTTALTTGTLVFAKVVIEPLAVYSADYDLAEANDIDVSSATTTAVTIGTADDNLDGSWIYVNSGTGAGQLAFVGAATTTVLTLDTTTAFSTAPDATSDIVLVRKRGLPTGGKDLNAAGTLLATDEDETGAYAVIQNYIETSTISRHPLEPRTDHLRTGLSNSDLILSSDIYPLDHAFRGPETI